VLKSTRFALALGLIASLLVAPTHAVATGSAEACTGYVDAPHVSKGAGGVIFKSRVTCRIATTVTLGMWMYRCAKAPTGSWETWPKQGCTLQFTQTYYYRFAVKAGDMYTRYCPPNGTKGAPLVKGRYYVGLTTFMIPGRPHGITRARGVWM
jgi:hypothetical protein